jgi:hypothetical protein
MALGMADWVDQQSAATFEDESRVASALARMDVVGFLPDKGDIDATTELRRQEYMATG